MMIIIKDAGVNAVLDQAWTIAAMREEGERRVDAYWGRREARSWDKEVAAQHALFGDVG